MTFLKTFKTHFCLRKTFLKKVGTFPINARNTIDGKRADLSTLQITFADGSCSNRRRIKLNFYVLKKSMLFLKTS
ncbi:hypothetical protein EV196_11176 [Mariniflexile fucanivorans]|uniref:Uncharacterized protein n=1 Tax=Mariniflexile fucanivorans TaxID=264023 RepID=A0A4R1RB84_9FLAO|nr:hypothetical protein EV196_11176 [Mariniflexile fucanivorans]